MLFYGVLCYLEYCALNWKVCVCLWLFMDAWMQNVFSRGIFVSRACSLTDMPLVLWPVWAGDSLWKDGFALGEGEKWKDGD